MAPLPPRSPVLQQFFRPVGQDVAANPDRRMGRSLVARTGALVSFNYTFWRNDPYPLIIIIENNPGKDKISGVNLHYLTFRDIRDLIGRAGKMGFSYRSVSESRPFRDAYRSYKRSGVRQMKVLDPSYLMGVMGMVRSFDPADAQIVRRQVQEQLRQQINPKANQAANLDQAGGAEPASEADG
jgi:hypothetical protein